MAADIFIRRMALVILRSEGDDFLSFDACQRGNCALSLADLPQARQHCRGGNGCSWSIFKGRGRSPYPQPPPPFLLGCSALPESGAFHIRPCNSALTTLIPSLHPLFRRFRKLLGGREHMSPLPPTPRSFLRAFWVSHVRHSFPKLLPRFLKM